MRHVFAFLTALLCAAPALVAQVSPVTVFAAASLRGVLDEVAEDYEAGLALSFGGSGTMARQVAQGAPADLVILASPLWMDWLVDQGVVGKADVAIMAANRLVVVGQPGAEPITDIAMLPARLGRGRLAMGQRDAVPAGAYAQEWLRQAGIWPQLEDHLAETDNVRAALALVASGETPLGIVYATDARADPAVEVLFAVPEHQHSEIVYPAAALTPSGAAFLAHLREPENMAIFASHGFAPVIP